MIGFFFASVLAATSAAPPFVAQTCRDAQLAKVARCGTVTVPENRDRAGGRSIALNIVILPATGPAPHLPPLFDIDGGPGLPSTKNVGFYATDGAAYRTRRDIVFVDQRGTGASNPLHCPELSAPEVALKPLFDPAAVERCATLLAESADLLQYGTAEAVRDLDTVRAALGYRRMDLSGTSYGTTVALEYLAAYPQRVRAAFLMGVNPPDAFPPRLHAQAGERALALLFDSCRRDKDCASLGDPDANLAKARAALPRIAGAPSDEVFMEKLRALMYTPGGARRVPFLASTVSKGDLAPFYAATKPQPSPNADGMFMAIICSESMEVMDVAAARRAAANTRFGDYRLRRQQEACAKWPSRAMKPGAPAASDAAVLLISGEFDPVTSPELAEAVERKLPNARHIVIPGSGHIFDGMSGIDTCLDPLIVRFLDSGDAKSADAACVAAMRPPPFVTGASQR